MRLNWFVVILTMGFLVGCSDSMNTGGKPKEPPKLTAEQALAELRSKAEGGDAQAQFELGNRYVQGDGVAKDVAKAVEWWSKAAGQGEANAQFGLGQMYERGEGVPKDVSKAADLYLKAAESGLAVAQNNLGGMYSRGDGVSKNEAKAVVWYRKAAEQGIASAQNALGLAYVNGTGVPKDEAVAAEWWRKAAEQGVADAQFRLGACYLSGRGLPKDKVRAYMWINLAAAQGDDAAIPVRDAIELFMTAEQIAEAQRLTREWKPGKHLAPKSSNAIGRAREKAGTGTAFVVSEQGHLLTNQHVVTSCGQVRLSGNDKPLKLLPQDAANDLALLQMADKPQSIAVFRNVNDLRQGESIAVYGYPLEGALAAGGNLSPGVVSALAGLGNNTSQIQITAPVQPGNSGGPVFDGKGQVVGVVVQKLDAVKVAKLTGDVPQNVNFAVNEATARAFLDSNQVPYTTGHWWQFFGKSLEDTAAEARKYTVVVECWK